MSKKNSIIQKENLPKTERDIALIVASKVHKKFDKIVKASILFGSQAKKEATIGSDIDIMFIIDDASINWDLELIAWYREELGKILSQDPNSKDLHITTVKLTTWWNDLLKGDPVIINVLRYGEALIDSGGFFNPIKSLLLQGKIHSTYEAVYTTLQRAPNHLSRSKLSILNALEGAYWCMIESAQAALMMAGKIPPSPEHIPALLGETFVNNKMLNMSAVNAVRDIYLLHKSIAHGAQIQIKGSDIDLWQNRAEQFLKDMTRIINELLDAKNKK